MALPVRIRNVHYYRIAGHYTFAGDLFIARGSLYFFPEVDLAEQREKVSRHVPHELGLLLLAITWLAQRAGSYSSRTEFWQDGMTHERFQIEASAHLDKLKLEKLSKAPSVTLPLPTHVRAEEISGIRLTPRGVLSFRAQSDTHDFNIGVLRKNQVRNVLWEAGLGRV
ncbi:MAG TPA: hypothetical protein VFZ22_09035 [Pyrinomonadaceae bacterium]|nr:hypothetical protein [Pyrinomonadaceae bacterium]